MLVRKTFMMGGTDFRGSLATYWLTEMYRHKVDVSRNGDDSVVRALETHQYDQADLMTARCYMWVGFIVGSRLTLGAFLRFSSLHKNQHLQISIPAGLGTRMKPSKIT